jgi:hypothetical protein
MYSVSSNFSRHNNIFIQKKMDKKAKLWSSKYYTEYWWFSKTNPTNNRDRLRSPEGWAVVRAPSIFFWMNILLWREKLEDTEYILIQSCYPIHTNLFSCSQRHLHYFAFQSSDFNRTPWMSSQKLVTNDQSCLCLRDTNFSFNKLHCLETIDVLQL